MTSWHDFVFDGSTQTESTGKFTVATATESTSYVTVGVDSTVETSDAGMETESAEKNTSDYACQTEIEESTSYVTVGVDSTVETSDAGMETESAEKNTNDYACQTEIEGREDLNCLNKTSFWAIRP
uniref:Uncharacterized protein n=1 Tax=Steinernema glaseri TaxID=37863 RepID=A0A1I8A2W6_9BILA